MANDLTPWKLYILYKRMMHESIRAFDTSGFFEGDVSHIYVALYTLMVLITRIYFIMGNCINIINTR